MMQKSSIGAESAADGILSSGLSAGPVVPPGHDSSHDAKQGAGAGNDEKGLATDFAAPHEGSDATVGCSTAPPDVEAAKVETTVIGAGVGSCTNPSSVAMAFAPAVTASTKGLLESSAGIVNRETSDASLDTLQAQRKQVPGAGPPPLGAPSLLTVPSNPDRSSDVALDERGGNCGGSKTYEVNCERSGGGSSGKLDAANNDVVTSSGDDVEHSCSPSAQLAVARGLGRVEGYIGKRQLGHPVAASPNSPDSSEGGTATPAAVGVVGGGAAGPWLAISGGVEYQQTGGQNLVGSPLPARRSSEVESTGAASAAAPVSQECDVSVIARDCAKLPGTPPSSDAGWLELEGRGCCVLPLSETTATDFEPRVAYSQEPPFDASLAELATVLSRAAAEQQPTMMERRFLPLRRIEALLVDGPASFPKAPLPGFATELFFSKLDIDTLFFCFHHQQKTYQQLLAAEQFKKRSWVFDRELRTWCRPEDD